MRMLLLAICVFVLMGCRATHQIYDAESILYDQPDMLVRRVVSVKPMPLTNAIRRIFFVINMIAIGPEISSNFIVENSWQGFVEEHGEPNTKITSDTAYYETKHSIKSLFVLEQVATNSIRIHRQTIRLDEIYARVLESRSEPVNKGVLVLTGLEPVTLVWLDAQPYQLNELGVRPLLIEMYDRFGWTHRRAVGGKGDIENVQGCDMPYPKLPSDCEHWLFLGDFDYTQFDHVKIVFED